VVARDVRAGDDDLVTVFAIASDRASSTLAAIDAMNAVGNGDMFTVRSRSGAFGTMSATACSSTVPDPPAVTDFTCQDSDS
jgi:hypothetical protein